MSNRDPIAATETEPSKLSLFGSLTTDLWVLGGTLGLAFVGVAITYVNKDLSYLYWLTDGFPCSAPSVSLLSGRVG